MRLGHYLADRDRAAADRYRDEIRAKGYVVEDRQAGPLVKAVDG